MIYEIRSRATRAPLGAFEAETPEEAIAAMLVARGIPSDSSALLCVNLDGLEVVPGVVADLAALGWANDLNGFHGSAGACFGDAFRLAEQDAERVERVRLERADMSNTCEHGDHPAPAGRRFCSDACAECERGGDACSPECLAAGDGAHAPHEKPRPFDGPTYSLGKG